MCRREGEGWSGEGKGGRDWSECGDEEKGEARGRQRSPEGEGVKMVVETIGQRR